MSDAVVPPAVALKALAKEKGLLVVVAHASREEVVPIRTEAEGKADVVVVVDAAGQVAYDKPIARAKPAGPLLVRIDEHAKEAGVLSFERKDDAWLVSWRAVVLDPSLDAGETPAA